MTSFAFVFPGQGAQTIGMGKTLAEAYPAAKAVFDEVDEALGEKLSTLIWEGDIAALTLTLWVLAETWVRRNWLALVAIPATFCIGVSCGLPLYLFLRTRPVV